MIGILRSFAVFALSGVLGVVALPVTPSSAAEGESAIKARVEFMDKELYARFKVLAAFAKNGQGTLGDVAKNAREIAGLANRIPENFPQGTGRGDYPDKVTRALPAIWSDWQGFEKATDDLMTGATRLAELARAGNREAVIDMIGTTGRYSGTQIGCAGCHEKYQGPKVR